MTTDTLTEEPTVTKFHDKDRVRINAEKAYPELHDGLATVIGYDGIFDEYKLVLDNVPRGYEHYTWDVRSWTLPARYLEATDIPNPDPRPWPTLRRHDRVLVKATGLVGTIDRTRPTDAPEADYAVNLDNKRKIMVREDEVEKFTDEWKFNGIVHRVRVTPDHSGREGGGWMFMVNDGMRDNFGWVRADAAQALARMILGLPAEDGDADILDAQDA